MKIRRALAAAAATAVIAPVALLTAPAAFADGDATPSPSASVTSTESPTDTPSPTASVSTEPSATTTPSATSTPDPTATPSATATDSASPTGTPSATGTPSPSASTPEETETPEPEPSECADTKVDVSFSGLPGKIQAGSGWHEFSLNVVNNSDSTLQDLAYLAGASPDQDGEELFKSKQVTLQAYNPDGKRWETLDEAGWAVGWAGVTDELKPDYEVNVPLRVNVKAGAPVGAGFTLGATIYGDADSECVGFGEVAYKFQIVAPGTDTDGTEPQEGGSAPVTDEQPAANAPQVNGSLAETGSSSALPVIGLVGGAAVLAGAGAIFVVRRRKAGTPA
ncbi:LAETG motif-containing sortase-dependent surface protein [Streptomyces sp. NPDC003717]|uniref:LAETG motif-containing sortase-dependent surface protein n=1 Tax=Streptomyces sp. NPDC003717 TaxID=3154276 RepID=UPI0033AB883D